MMRWEEVHPRSILQALRLTACCPAVSTWRIQREMTQPLSSPVLTSGFGVSMTALVAALAVSMPDCCVASVISGREGEQRRSRSCARLTFEILLSPVFYSMSRTLVGIGCTSGLGFEALKQLLTQSSPGCARWRVILSARSPESGQSAVTKLQKCTSSHTQITWLPLDLARFPSDVISFSDRLKQHLEADHSTIDCLLLNAGMYSTRSIVSAGRWCQEAIVNHFGASA